MPAADTEHRATRAAVNESMAVSHRGAPAPPRATTSSPPPPPPRCPAAHHHHHRRRPNRSPGRASQPASQPAPVSDAHMTHMTHTHRPLPAQTTVCVCVCADTTAGGHTTLTRRTAPRTRSCSLKTPSPSPPPPSPPLPSPPLPTTTTTYLVRTAQRQPHSIAAVGLTVERLLDTFATPATHAPATAQQTQRCLHDPAQSLRRYRACARVEDERRRA
jgi:hypothetical protein